MSTSGQKWAKVAAGESAAVRRELLRLGGRPARGLGRHEAWRIRLPGATVTSYRNGTLYMALSGPSTAEASAARAFIDRAASPSFVPTDRRFAIGFDESGKSEVAGDVILVGVLVPRDLAPEAEAIVGTAETKTRHPATYFERLASALEALQPRGLEVVVEPIGPHDLDRYNLNGLFDATYARIARDLFGRVRLSAARVAADDYRIRGPFRAILGTARTMGAEVFWEHGADDRYLEARVASVIARRERELIVEAMNHERWQIDGLGIGAGHSGHPETQAWLRAWKASGQEWPPFIRRSWRPICALDGGPVPEKPYPPNQDGVA